jgi:hypothetical protein
MRIGARRVHLWLAACQPRRSLPMDGQRFDDLLRTLASGSSRRAVLSHLASGLLAPLTLTESTEAKKKRGKGKKKRRCTPKCAGKTCGKDGCGGSCGPCAGFGECVNGTCVCAGDSVFCRGACVPGCIGEAIINPLTCECCGIGSDCITDAECCSGFCHLGGPSFCRNRFLGDSCDFDAQCSGFPCPGCPICHDDQCTCPDGFQPCQGQCVPPCSGGNMQIPGACSCCRLNGQTCGGVTPCCSGDCDTTVVPSTCRGLLTGAPCNFDEQCASGDCLMGFCDD